MTSWADDIPDENEYVSEYESDEVEALHLWANLIVENDLMRAEIEEEEEW